MTHTGAQGGPEEGACCPPGSHRALLPSASGQCPSQSPGWLFWDVTPNCPLPWPLATVGTAALCPGLPAGHQAFPEDTRTHRLHPDQRLPRLHGTRPPTAPASTPAGRARLTPGRWLGVAVPLFCPYTAGNLRSWPRPGRRGACRGSSCRGRPPRCTRCCSAPSCGSPSAPAAAWTVKGHTP